MPTVDRGQEGVPWKVEGYRFYPGSAVENDAGHPTTNGVRNGTEENASQNGVIDRWKKLSNIHFENKSTQSCKSRRQGERPMGAKSQSAGEAL
jgi:hypothetical protein